MKKSLIVFLLALVFTGMVRAARAAAVAEVAVTGVEGLLRANVLAYLSIEQQKNDPDLTEPIIRGLHEKAPDEIRSALQPFGYYKPSIRSELVRKDGIWLAGYAITPGEPVRIERIDFIISGPGSGESPLKKAKERFPLKKGDVLNQELYEKAKRDLQDLAVDEGYLDARFPVHRIDLYLMRDAAAIELQFDTGPLYRFGKVAFKQDMLKPEFLGRFVPFKEGDPYKLAKLNELQSSLYGTDYFSQVNVLPRREAAEDLLVPVEVDLVPNKRQKYTLGAGYGTDTGLRGIFGWEVRRVNRSGHRFNTELRYSQIQRNFTTRYIIPMRNPATDHLDFTAGWNYETTSTSTSDVRLVGPSYIHMRGLWQEAFYLNLQRENYDVGGDTGRATMLLPGASWTRIKANDRIYTTHGSRVIFDIRGTDRVLGSSIPFAQLRTNIKFIRRLWDGGRIILRGDFGFSEVSKFRKLPASQRFFAGGDQSVRGYAYKSLGPLNSLGNVVGGKHLIVGSFEYDQRIYKKWGAAVFYDAGNALNTFADPLKHGAGLGVRWNSPVGSVRLDFAWALNPMTSRHWRIHVGIGPDL